MSTKLYRCNQGLENLVYGLQSILGCLISEAKDHQEIS